ncbi:MAG: hypothetical protein UY81_C0047G0005 [Candidatus Giovannonibacteria bacterium GW2011_GWA2_53_7]|uniref:Transmembrane protein n=1 Tax=Candidatus Giovannonibacteria bacterium GW2011_GWA2_53_7 TaxID=1618650 RepID=A0A0G1XVP2_9BACT|nr:MAG: hypothetical protein UY81_C0047G0005 [Candidatus Giovannonibacteria bacterium GW2011_GWA2_53_7]
MTTIPLAIALLPLALFLILFLIFSLLNLFHIIHYGLSSVGKFFVIVIYVAGTLFLLGSSYIALSPYDWQQPISSNTFFDTDRPINLFELPTVPLREQEKDNTL